MADLSQPLMALAANAHFIIHENKEPRHWNQPKVNCSPNLQSNWIDYKTASEIAESRGPDWGVGYVLSDENKYFCIDIDHCLLPDGNWSPFALSIVKSFPGAAVEVSRSGEGLHIFGSYTGEMPKHSCRNREHGIEFYHTDRYIAINDHPQRAVGNVETDCTHLLQPFIDKYFPPSDTSDRTVSVEWRDKPIPGWDDKYKSKDEIINAARNAKLSAETVFGDKASFSDLFDNNEAALAVAFPPNDKKKDTYNRSSADMAFAIRLAYWTGKDHALTWEIMWDSKLRRDKWRSHPTYLQNTIIKAATLQKKVFGQFETVNNDGDISVNPEGETSPLEKLRALSVTRRIDEMKKNLANDVYIFDGLALSGQITLFYAKPNTGKTLLFLHFIIEAIKKGVINAANIFYINADDDYKGLFTKGKLAAKHGFEMISPAEAGMTTKYILTLLDEMSQSDEAAGKVIILDTLKKFTDLMDKKVQLFFYELLRKFILKKGTVIMAGHTNKKTDDDGNLICEGTADTMNDIDCAYSINLMSPTEGDVIVEFRNEKSRGDVVTRVSYGYTRKTGMHYFDIINSVHKLDARQFDEVNTQNKIQLNLEKFDSERVFVQTILLEGALNQSAICQWYKDGRDDEEHPCHNLVSGFSRQSLQNALKALTGISWTSTRHSYNNALFYELIK